MQVAVNQCGWGSVFIGVAPRGSPSWGGHGFLNYRACQAHGSETLYGAYYTAGDKVSTLHIHTLAVVCYTCVYYSAVNKLHCDVGQNCSRLQYRVTTVCD
jgi:hypothetical protein